jgi:hypothetical protein
MNKDKKMQIAKTMARRILTTLSNEDYFDGFVTRFFTRTKCINYLQKAISEYFRKNAQLINWNKNTWFDIFDDTFLLEALVFYMQDFNLAKEIEAEEEEANPKIKKRKVYE